MIVDVQAGDDDYDSPNDRHESAHYLYLLRKRVVVDIDSGDDDQHANDDRQYPTHT